MPFVNLEADPKLAELVAMLKAGHEVVITEGDVPVARLTYLPPKPKGPRISPLHPGNVIYMADDFDAPLPDEFWLGES